MLRISELSFRYRRSEVLRNVDLGVQPGEFLSLVGPNGVGKSTLLRCILGTLKPARGDILIDGVPIRSMSRKERARHLAYVPQSTPIKFPMKVFDVVLMGRKPYLHWTPSRRDLEAVDRLLSAMDLSEIALRDFSLLSGGQQQKVILARAFAQEARYLLLDEPISNLDLRHQLDVMEMLLQMVREKQFGVILAIHDLNLAERFSDTVVMLSEGAIYAWGKPDEVLCEESIRKIYGVEVAVMQNNGCRHIVSLRGVRQSLSEPVGKSWADRKISKDEMRGKKEMGQCDE